MEPAQISAPQEASRSKYEAVSAKASTAACSTVVYHTITMRQGWTDCWIGKDKVHRAKTANT
ncbi:hypothetical protein CONLIGDRAFT_631898 [Coniochaeta ligniaria NRRL 30616]|uniref:Uncharacterized protein n=1 Tax=Coniochaeta ligniaria NRRL 30616 TaxID=1408157 RepID=A0A1J7IRK7_9PEZI|nr:hypothetical protein CONLIGDRAFT_631898 [Coniochaeta ligniaria NRRL 30616]